MMRGYGYQMMSYGWGLFMMIGIVALIILGIVVLVHYLQNNNKPMSKEAENKALNILNEKFANGEITEEEYKNKKAHIKS